MAGEDKVKKERTPEDKAKVSAYGAATTALRNMYDDDFMRLLQEEYDKRGLGEAPASRAASRAAREATRKMKVVSQLEKQREKLRELEAKAEDLGLDIDGEAEIEFVE